MNCILVFLIFSSVIAAVSARECEVCTAYGERVTNCRGEIVTCPREDDICITQVEVNNLSKIKSKKTTVRKTCFPVNEGFICDQLMAHQSDDFQIYLYSNCCTTDNCNRRGIRMPPINTKPNGHYCETCFVKDKTECDKTEFKPCFGNQLQCISFSGNATRPDDCSRPYAFKGCVTYGACFANLYNLPGSKLDCNAIIKCT